MCQKSDFPVGDLAPCTRSFPVWEFWRPVPELPRPGDPKPLSERFSLRDSQVRDPGVPSQNTSARFPKTFLHGGMTAHRRPENWFFPEIPAGFVEIPLPGREILPRLRACAWPQRRILPFIKLPLQNMNGAAIRRRRFLFSFEARGASFCPRPETAPGFLRRGHQAWGPPNTREQLRIWPRHDLWRRPNFPVPKEAALCPQRRFRRPGTKLFCLGSRFRRPGGRGPRFLSGRLPRSSFPAGTLRSPYPGM